MSDLARDLVALARERRAFLDALDALSPEQRAFRPEPGAWSPSEIAEHLYRVERGTPGVIDRQVAAGDGRRDLGPPSPARLLATLAALRTPARFKVPESAAAHIAPTGEAYEEVREGWRTCERRWRALAEGLPPELEGVGLVLHPLAGPLTLADAASFCAVHAGHHRGQLDRAVRAATAAVTG